jgi:hypothetical protein
MAPLTETIRNSRTYQVLTYDITMEDIVGTDRFERMRETKAYKFASDWCGLATNKVVLGMYMDSQAGMLPGTSVMARAISLGVHSVTSPAYTVFRDFVYKRGNITPDRSLGMRYGAELLAFNGVQTTLYVAQIAAAITLRAALDPDVDFDPNKIANGAFKFFQNSWWLAFAGKWTMDSFRKFFGSKTPEQLAEPNETNLEEIVQANNTAK